MSDVDSYKSLSKAATVSVVIGLLSLTGFIFSVFVSLGLLAIIFGVIGFQTATKYSHEFTGAPVAIFGLMLGSISLFGGVGYHYYVYQTEIRKGYERVSFAADLKETAPGKQVSDKAIELDGKPIFLKGYVRPGLRTEGMTEFLMVGDFGDCCFGGNPKISELVMVKLPEGVTARYDWQLKKVHGTFKLNRRLQKGERIAKDITGYVYEIEADSFE